MLVKITPLIQTPDFIKGVINLRGAIFSVSDLKMFFDLGITDVSKSSRIIICCNQNQIELGLLVEEIGEIILIPENEIQKSTQALNSNASEYIFGIYQTQNEPIVIIDVEKIFISKLFNCIKKEQ
jgi:purine-binding chemotaxis protein CheW